MTMKIFRAKFVVPVDSPLIEDGAVAVCDGRIAEVDRWTTLSHQTGADVTDFGEAVILPGFVNAHTHLELTNLGGRVPPTPDFADWILRLAKLIAVEANAQEQVGAAVREGVRRSLADGVTTIGDIARRPQLSRAALSQTAIRAVSYGEVIAVGTIRDRLDAAIADACGDQCHTNRVRTGLSPHSPYTVEPDGLRECARRANESLCQRPSPLLLSLGGRGVDDPRPNPIPLCIHLAETLDEERFTLHGDGPIADLLKALGVWDKDISIPRMRPVPLANNCGLLTPRTILAHANYVTDEDIRMIAGSGASVAYCPRTHHAFGHAPHRFRDMISAGVNVCVGTDSLASNPSLSVLDELRFLGRQHRDVRAELLVRMGTIHGARALGLANECGSFAPGKIADLVALSLEKNAPRWESVFDTESQPVAVIVSGRQPGHTAS